MIFRGLAGLILGATYGLVAGALTFLVFLFTSDNPGPMIPNNNEWGRIVVLCFALIAGGCGSLVGLVVGLSGVSRGRGGMIGAAVGLVLCLILLLSSWDGLTRLSWPLLREFLSVWILFLLVFPVGLGLTGMVVSIIVSKLRR
jgi:hypothetical protein